MSQSLLCEKIMKKNKKNRRRVFSWHSIVCIKPVPDPSQFDKLRLDPETMMLVRSDVPQVINPVDRLAIAAAVNLKKRFRGIISVLTMAPSNASEQLHEALALGCDKAYLLSDKAFAGADTLATARVLAAAIRKLGRFNLILTGCYSADGSTGQVGPQLAELLGLPELTHVTNLQIRRGKLRADCRLENGLSVQETSLPALITLDQQAGVAAHVSSPIRGLQNALQKKISVLSASDLGLNSKDVGLSGSPTRMFNIFTPSSGRKGEILQGQANEVVTQLLEKLRKEQRL